MALLPSTVPLPAKLLPQEATARRRAVLELAAAVRPRELLEAALLVRTAAMH